MSPRPGSSRSCAAAGRGRWSACGPTWTPCRSPRRRTSRSRAHGGPTFLGQEVGVAHACGHDIHTSVRLGVASVLAACGRRPPPEPSSSSSSRPKKARLPGEEGGAEVMIREGALDDPRPAAIFALHSFPELADASRARSAGRAGRAGRPSPRSTSSSPRSGASRRTARSPHLGVDPVVMAAQVVLALADDPLAHPLGARAERGHRGDRARR